MAFDKVNLKHIRADIDAALKAVATKHKMSLSLLRITLRAKLEAAVVTNGAAMMNPKTYALEHALRLYSKMEVGRRLEPGEKLKHASLGVVSIVGYNVRARQYPFIVKTVAGKAYKLAAHHVKGML